MAIVREDVVKLGFEFDSKAVDKANDAVDDLVDKTQELGGPKGTGKAEDGFEEAAKAANKFGKTDLSKLSDGIDKIVDGVGKFALKMGKATAKTIAAGTAAATAGIVALSSQAIESYAEYEQLIGGVDTLFGQGYNSVDEYAASIGRSVDEIKAFQKANGLVVDGIIGPKTSAAIAAAYDKMAAGSTSAADKVLKNANDAYKTAGLSANEYMSTVTSFSASLINSLGGDTQKAADMADMAIIDMADNANKMGTDMSLIQNAYQGFAKQNYTMLDNLKLGYGGTQEEMKRLLKDAEKISGKKFDMSNFADVVEAIHIIQDEMGIAGTTAKEASETIQGSALAMKAAWQNFVTGLADENADFEQLFDNLMDSVKTFLKNIIPRVKKMLPRLIKGLTEIAKAIGQELPDILEDLLPALVEGAVDLLGSMYDVLKANAGVFKSVGLSIIKAIYKGFTGEEMPEDMLNTLKGKIDEVAEAAKNILSGLADFGAKLFVALGPALLWIADIALAAFTWIGDNIEWLLPILGSLLGAMLAFKAVKKVTGIVQGFMGLFSLGGGKKGGAGGDAAGGMMGDTGKGGFFRTFANMKPTTILKAMGNIAIIVGGITAIAALLMWAAPYLSELTDAGSFGKLIAAIAVVGVVGTALTKMAAPIGNIPVATVAKGLANIAIIMVGMGALAFVLGWASSKFDFDIKEMLKLLGIITVVGLVGSALAALGGLVGAIPIPVVLTGLANIALALGGITAVIAAFGAISKIDGFNDFITSGGALLADICGIIGEMAGSLIGGIGEGITNSLPEIGDNISAFAASLEPAMTTFSGMNFDGLKNFASAFGDFILAMTGEKIASWFTGGIDYAKIGTDLTALTTNGAGFFKAVQSIPEAAFTNAGKLFECLNGIGLLPNSGGVAQWFTGEVNYQSIADGIAILAGAGMISALTAIAGIPAESFTALTSMFNALAGIKQMPKEGGIVSWFAGDNSTALTSVAEALPGVATNIAAFFTNLGGRTDFSAIKNLFETIGNIDINADAASKGFLGLGTSDFEKIGTGLSAFATNAAGFFSTIDTYSASTISEFFAAIGEGGELPAKLTGLDGTIGTTMSNIATTVSTNLSNIKTNLETELNAMIATISLKQTGFFNAGVNIMQGLNGGILSMESVVMATVRRIAAKIKSTFESAQKIHSPSKVMFESATWSGMGIVEGLRSTIPAVETATQDMSTAMIPYGDVYTPESSATYYNGGNSESTTISPVFNLTISGTQDDRATARRVKRYVAEAIEKTFESMERRTHAIREV